MKTRVAILGEYPFDNSRLHGGVQAAFSYLVQGLAGLADIETHILTFAPDGYSGPGCLERDGSTIHLMPSFPPLERLRGYRHYQATLNQLLDGIRPHVLHSEDAVMNGYVALRSAYPAVVTVHGIRYEDGKHFRSFGQRMRGLYDGLLIERSVIHRARHLIAISRYLTRYFEARFRPDIRLYYIPNAINARFFDLPAPGDSQDILYAGRVIPLKRVKDLVLAFALLAAKFPGASLRLAGDTRSEPAYVAEIRALAREKGLEERVHFLGALSEEEVLAEYRRCAMLALASAQENLPMSLAQAMAAGRPVIATGVGGVPEMLGEKDERGLLVKPGDIQALAGGMARLLGDRALREQLAGAAGEYARQNYHMNQVAARTAEVYRLVAAEEQTHG